MELHRHGARGTGAYYRTVGLAAAGTQGLACLDALLRRPVTRCAIAARITIGGFGHYEDDLVKVDGEWLFARRRIYNEGTAEWAAPPGNPAW